MLTTNQQTLPADDKNTTVYVSGVSVKEPATDQMNANFTTQLQQANVQQVDVVCPSTLTLSEHGMFAY